MPTLLAEADIYVSTSLSDGTSVSLLEAMGSGAFPIVTDILSNREWIADGVNGFLVSPESERNLAGRIIEVIRNRTLIDQAHEKNQKITEERARWLSLIRRIDELYQGCK
jgi:glycosyltransferase involved in cell wall biosynthesis